MILRNNYIPIIAISILFVFYQPIPISKGQSVDNKNIQLFISPVATITDKYIDTLGTKYKMFSNLVDESKENVKVSKTQVDKLQKQGAVIAKQNTVIDSLLKMKEDKLTKISLKKTGQQGETRWVIKAGDTVYVSKRKKTAKDLKIFHIFDKKH